MPHRPVSPNRYALTFGLLLTCLAPLGACHLNLSTDVEAKDQWSRSYPLSAAGTLSISNGNGRIDVTGGDGNTVTITAERIVKASTEEAAKQQLALYEIKEDVSPDRISIDSSTRGVSINVSRRVNYTVTMPRGASLSLVSTNGEVVVANVGGHFTAEASNGSIRATNLQRSAKVSTTNGVVNLAFDAVAGDGITAETTNGTITLTVPKGTNADLSARVTNGAINRENLDLQVSEESRRRLDGRLGSGGTQIRLETTNGAITVKGR